MPDDDSARVPLPGEAAAAFHTLASHDTDVQLLIERGINVLLSGVHQESDSEDADDIRAHLMRTRAMYWAMLCDAVQARRTLKAHQEERRRLLQEMPELERVYRKLQARGRE